MKEPEERIPLRKAKFTVQTALAYRNFQASLKGDPPWSINEVARRINVSPTTVHRFFREESDPKRAMAMSLDMATRLCSVLNCEIGELMEVEETDMFLDDIDKD